MKAVFYLPRASRALPRHRTEAGKIIAKIEAYARNPAAQANKVKRLKGRTPVLRLRVGSFRVLFTENSDALTIIDIGPRASIYE
jgi:mRNA interferase RelE/StbE